MPMPGLTHNVISYYTAIVALGKSRILKEGVSLSGEMAIVGITAGIVPYGSAIKACADEKCHEEALILFHEMLKYRSKPNVSS